MAYNTISSDTGAQTPTLTRVSGTTVAIRATRRQDRPESRPQTTIYLTQEVAREAGLRKGSRVSILSGTGRDEGKVRIVANRNGTYRVGATGSNTYTLRIRTNNLLRTTTRTTKEAKVTGVAKGALAFAL